MIIMAAALPASTGPARGHAAISVCVLPTSSRTTGRPSEQH